MRKYLLMLLVLSVAVFCACEKEEDGMAMQFVETLCDNPWDAIRTQESYVVEVRSFLENNEIKVIKINIDVYDESVDESCTACSCVTGRNIIIRVPPYDVDEAKELGFTIL